MTGYHVVDPGGHLLRLQAETFEERLEIVSRLVEKWADYCTRNWISSNVKEKWSPENKVKSFLDGLAYFLMQGRIGTDGDIVTDYKNIMNGKREIPVSSCPPSVANALYGWGFDPRQGADDTGFTVMTEMLDEKAAKVERPKKKKPFVHKPPRRELYAKAIGTDAYVFEEYRVDTANTFSTPDGGQYCIASSVPQYCPVMTAEGLLYDMDKIIRIRADGGRECWFDMAGCQIDGALVERL